MASPATITGFIAAATIVVTTSLPLGHLVRTRRRAAPRSTAIGVHAALGAASMGTAFLHTLMVMPSLGSSAALEGGMVALVPAAVAFFVLVAHAGIGLQLRREKLRDRAKKRRTHVATATIIALMVLAHTIALERAAR